MNPPKTNDLDQWAEYFIQINQELLEQGFDMSNDREIMKGWFSAVFVLGYDQGVKDQSFLHDEIDRFIGELDE